jgi:hypothetical protein
VAELSSTARAAVGPARAELGLRYAGVAIGLVLVAAAFVLTWTAEGATPRKVGLPALSEVEAAAHNFQAHLATAAELGTQPVRVPVSYPDETAPGVTATMHQGFAPHAPNLPAPGVIAW